MTVTAVGCDVVEVARLRRLLAARPGARERLFSPVELADARRAGAAEGSVREVERLAARFAGKEAVRKALRARGPALLAVEVRTAPDGAPEVWLEGRRSTLACSLSHDGGVALAVVVGILPADPASADPAGTDATAADPVGSVRAGSDSYDHADHHADHDDRA
jgi:holo-[acyl-carrier protein] synthase